MNSAKPLGRADEDEGRSDRCEARDRVEDEDENEECRVRRTERVHRPQAHVLLA